MAQDVARVLLQRVPVAPLGQGGAVCEVAAISWVARGITRNEQGNRQLAARDFEYAASLYEQGGEASQGLTR